MKDRMSKVLHHALKAIDAEIGKMQTTRDAVVIAMNGYGRKAPVRRKHHTMSAAARRKIGKAQRARWAKLRRAA